MYTYSDILLYDRILPFFDWPRDPNELRSWTVALSRPRGTKAPGAEATELVVPAGAQDKARGPFPANLGCLSILVHLSVLSPGSFKTIGRALLGPWKGFIQLPLQNLRV